MDENRTQIRVHDIAWPLISGPAVLAANFFWLVVSGLGFSLSFLYEF